MDKFSLKDSGRGDSEAGDSDCDMGRESPVDRLLLGEGFSDLIHLEMHHRLHPGEIFWSRDPPCLTVSLIVTTAQPHLPLFCSSLTRQIGSTQLSHISNNLYRRSSHSTITSASEHSSTLAQSYLAKVVMSFFPKSFASFFSA